MVVLLLNVCKKEPGKFHLIYHLSYSKWDLVKDAISLELCLVRYASFDPAVGTTIQMIPKKGCYLVGFCSYNKVTTWLWGGRMVFLLNAFFICLPKYELQPFQTTYSFTKWPGGRKTEATYHMRPSPHSASSTNLPATQKHHTQRALLSWGW